ncbi:MAG: hypothetical protein J7539_14830 [Niabella sp.]|nr:hypothetical protein [Niabella sp.]
MQNRYNYFFDNSTSTYTFATKNGFLYRVVFIIDETFSTISGEEIPYVFQIVIDKTTDELEPYDAKVSKTIEAIVERFFCKVENSLIYVCSGDNTKAKQRHQIFDRWYKKSEYQDIVMKIDNIITIATNNKNIQKLYTSFMFHKNNPVYEKLMTIYGRIEEVLSKDI